MGSLNTYLQKKMKPAGGMIKVAPIHVERNKFDVTSKDQVSSLGKIIEMGPEVEGFIDEQIIVYHPKKLTLADENGVKVGYIHQDDVEAIYE